MYIPNKKLILMILFMLTLWIIKLILNIPIWINSKFTTSNLLITTKVNSSSVALGDIYRLVKSVDNNTFSIERFSLNSVSNSNVWLSFFLIEYDVVIMHCKLYVDTTYMFAKLNEN